MNDNAKKWVAALRSGEYQQGQFNLRIGDDFCCLGVACDLFLKDGNDLLVEKTGSVFCFGKQSNVLPVSVQKWLGLKNKAGLYGANHVHSLIYQNDILRSSFAEIADFIEATETLFEDEGES